MCCFPDVAPSSHRFRRVSHSFVPKSVPNFAPANRFGVVFELLDFGSVHLCDRRASRLSFRQSGHPGSRRSTVWVASHSGGTAGRAVTAPMLRRASECGQFCSLCWRRGRFSTRIRHHLHIVFLASAAAGCDASRTPTSRRHLFPDGK